MTTPPDFAALAQQAYLALDDMSGFNGAAYLRGKLEAAHAAGRAEGLAALLPDIEKVSDQVHDAWMASKRAQGVTTRKSENYEELMVPYEQLSETAKDLDRGTVKAVYAAIRALAASDPAPRDQAAEGSREARLRKMAIEARAAGFNWLAAECQSEADEIAALSPPAQPSEGE
jgi:hypothetical protein